MRAFRRIAWCAALLVLVAGNHRSAAGSQGTRRAPNVLLIVVDDMGYGDLGCYGSKEIRTPAIDRLAKEGVRLTDFYANSAMCSPTRAALLTGRYPQRSGFDWAIGYGERGRGLAASETSLPRMMRDAGYRTAFFGKWHLGYDERYSAIATNSSGSSRPTSTITVTGKPRASPGFMKGPSWSTGRDT
jgi:arylsulfatase A-like enzyme